MIRRFRLHCVISWLSSPAVLLVIFWTAGLLLGALLAPAAADPLFSLMRPEFTGRVSIVSELITAILPLLLAAYAVNIHNTRLLILISFCRAFLFSYCGCFLYRIYGSAGWLVRSALQFADVLSVPVFCWFCIRQVNRGAGLCKRDLTVSVVLTLIAACLDSLIIAPFFANLIDIGLEGSLFHVGFDLRL